MPDQPKNPLHRFTETGPLVALVVAIALGLGIVGPASAQFFNFGGPPRPAPQQQQQRGGGGWFGSDIFAPFQQQAPQRPQDFSRAPPPAKRDATLPLPDRNILVLGDAMADWLAYGLRTPMPSNRTWG